MVIAFKKEVVVYHDCCAYATRATKTHCIIVCSGCWCGVINDVKRVGRDKICIIQRFTIANGRYKTLKIKKCRLFSFIILNIT